MQALQKTKRNKGSYFCLQKEGLSTEKRGMASEN